LQLQVFTNFIVNDINDTATSPQNACNPDGYQRNDNRLVAMWLVLPKLELMSWFR
jgi:hypothetical protein